MSDVTTVHNTFVIERTFAAAPAKVFAAFANDATKRRWFLEGLGERVLEIGFKGDFRVGGTERSFSVFAGGPKGAPPAGTKFRNETTYFDIVPNARIVFAYTMAMGERCISASLATVQLEPSGEGTRLVFTEQAAFFMPSDGAVMREDGWRQLFDQLAKVVREES